MKVRGLRWVCLTVAVVAVVAMGGMESVEAAGADPEPASTLHMSQSAGVTLTVQRGTLDVGARTIERIELVGDGPGMQDIAGQPTIVVPADASLSMLILNALPDNETSLHVHGQTPPLQMDGVPYIGGVPLPAGRSKYRAYQLVGNGLGTNTGSYFIHSHYGFQHSKGVALPIVVQGGVPAGYPLATELASAAEVMMYLEDVCPYLADDLESNPNCNDPWSLFYTLQSRWDAEAASFNYSHCMTPSTGADVLYRYHLANGRVAGDPAVMMAQAGEWLRVRIVSSTAMTTYRIVLDPALVGNAYAIAVDGQYVIPIAPEDGGVFWIAVAQRLDVLLRAPQDAGAYPIWAQVESTGSSLQSVLPIVVGGQSHVPAPGAYSAEVEDAPGLMTFDMEKRLRAFVEPGQAEPDWSSPDKVFQVDITGDNGFNSVNRHSYQLVPFAPFTANPRPLMVDMGDTVCIDMVNYNADPHPMHLHGHSFAVVEIDGVPLNGAIRDTLLMARGACHSARICFVADSPGAWPFHCHSSYHLAAGLLTTVEYSATPKTPADYSLPPGLGPVPAQAPAPAQHTGLTSGGAIAIGAATFIVLAVIAGVGIAVGRGMKARSVALMHDQPLIAHRPTPSSAFSSGESSTTR